MGRGFANADAAATAARRNARNAANAATRKERRAMRADREAEVSAAIPVIATLLRCIRSFPSDIQIQSAACEAIAQLVRAASLRGAIQHGVSQVQSIFQSYMNMAPPRLLCFHRMMMRLFYSYTVINHINIFRSYYDLIIYLHCCYHYNNFRLFSFLSEKRLRARVV